MDLESIKHSQPFSPVTQNDRAGQLWIATILSIIYSVCVALARTYIKYHMFGYDDILFALATILHIAQAIAVFVGLGGGLSKFNSNTTPDQWAISSKSTVAATILSLLSLCLAKCSVLALVLRIISSKPGKSKWLCRGLITLTVAWGIGSSLAWLVDCRADSLLTVDNVRRCPSQKARWKIITAIDIFTEIMTWLLVVQLSWSVRTSLNRKFQVVIAFSFRLPLIAASAIHLAYSRTYQTNTEPQFAITNALVCQQVMLVWSLLSATMPNLKNFLQSFSIGMGFPVAFVSTMSGNPDTYALQTLGKGRSANTSGAATAVGPYGWRSDLISNQATVTGDRDHSFIEGRLSRAGSREMIINKEVTWNVTYEDHNFSRY